MSMAALEYYAGVPHLKGSGRFNQAISKLARSTQAAGRFPFGGFSALVDFKKFKLRDPLLVATTDGVGTKLELARLIGKHDTIGIDLVAMSVNDLITCGAKPIFFLDYFASGEFDRKKTIEVLKGIANGCRQANCALVGGETAIMPGVYVDSTYDLAGFAIGLVERTSVIDGRRARPGHVLLGLASSGFHSNGFSLIRKIFTKKELAGRIGRRLLTPTRIYVRPLLDLARKVRVDGVAHITGGGFYDNLPRALPKGLGARINRGSWPIHKLFFEVQKRSHYSDRQMFHTFNMGIGMVLILKQSNVNQAQSILKNNRIGSWAIGTVEEGSGILICPKRNVS